MGLTSKGKFLKENSRIESFDDGGSNTYYYIKLICSRCKNHVADDGYGISTRLYIKSLDEDKINNALNNFEYFDEYKKPYCIRCSTLNTWEVILDHYLTAYSNDEAMIMAIKDIYRYVEKVHTLVNPAKFEKMLKDRFINPDQNDMRIWNMAVDECKIIGQKNPFEIITPSRWRENKVSNSILGFLGF